MHHIKPLKLLKPPQVYSEWVTLPILLILHWMPIRLTTGRVPQPGAGTLSLPPRTYFIQKIACYPNRSLTEILMVPSVLHNQKECINHFKLVLLLKGNSLLSIISDGTQNHSVLKVAILALHNPILIE